MAMDKKKLAAFVKGGSKAMPFPKFKKKGKPAPPEPESDDVDTDDVSAAVEDHEAEAHGEDEEDEGQEGEDAGEDEGNPGPDADDFADALTEDVRVVNRMARMTRNGNPGEPDKGQPAKGLAALEGAIGEEIVGGLTEWAKANDWEAFVELGERIGADDPEAFAGWLQAIKKGTGEG